MERRHLDLDRELPPARHGHATLADPVGRFAPGPRPVSPKPFRPFLDETLRALKHRPGGVRQGVTARGRERLAHRDVKVP
jgi:hypothetical protein